MTHPINAMKNVFIEISFLSTNTSHHLPTMASIFHYLPTSVSRLPSAVPRLLSSLSCAPGFLIQFFRPQSPLWTRKGPKLKNTFMRPATPEDSHIIASHRMRMFQDMGLIPDELLDEFLGKCRDDIKAAIESGKYIGWLVPDPAIQPESLPAPESLSEKFRPFQSRGWAAKQKFTTAARR